ncbi:Ubiquinone/menaquinone biosynthesis C-methylase UbiE [Nitrosomonas cryotolerans]|uniref:Ubiquinone/menaquinone biosynthesis C-methylase UbiE n=1 Tax=Nitrosomonas cryotolerans ATCC 49181 TaxID=1131553 RepID=A0A1N6IX82_9PROT|nr:class I SAM-dependent methyltransferase [Nitrosomonas cryotolerans]SFP85869.1 Ubiquinone/menaquinone biosynthesis C-methylase UbiE [Nitrosomonas cryotolerans]SIO36654.1 Ubiquinone/menaquinone biosynthesis C-methylase UbiE [Nitrosomonas cryotolerans ATCC 49181]
MTEPLRERSYVPALGYHWLTPYYDRVVNLTTRDSVIKQALIQQARFEAGQNVLDLACGTGTLAILIKRDVSDISVTAVDCDRTVLSLAEHKANRAGVEIQFDCAFSDHLPYIDAYYDRVVSSLFFHHLTWEDKRRAVSEVYRVLKPGGEFHIADWGRADNGLMRSVFLAVQLFDGFKNTQDNVTGKLVDLLEQASFSQVETSRSFNTILGTMALYRAVKNH